MMVKTIGSGSSGNGYALISGEDILLLECGVPAKEMLKAIDYQTSMVNGCILSHIHGDHAGYIKQYIQYGIMVYTSDEVETDVETVMGEKTIGLQRMKRQQLGTFSVIPFRVPHGETECDGWLIDTPDGRILFITDAEYCPYDFSKMHINYGLIECNYAEDYIRIEDSDPKYNHVLTGHMELETCKRLIQKINSVSIEDELATETLTYDGENAIYYMSDACYGYTVSIEDGKSGQSANVVSSGAYYVEIAVSGVAIGETVNITVKGYKYNVSTAYTVQTVNNRGTDKEWQNPIISDVEHSKQVATWLADYFSSGIEYELDYRGEPAIDCGDTIGQENKYDSNLKAVVEEAQITFDSGLLGGGLVTRRKGSVDRTKN